MKRLRLAATGVSTAALIAAVVVWRQMPPQAIDGARVYRHGLDGAQSLGAGSGPGPAGIAASGAGALTGTRDGRIVRIDAEGRAQPGGSTGGRSQGLIRSSGGTLLVADAERGLMATTRRTSAVICDSVDGVPLHYASDATITVDHDIYFLEASQRTSLAEIDRGVVPAADGRLLRYDETNRRCQPLTAGLALPLGLAATPDGKALLIVESGASRISRYWLKGPHAGHREAWGARLPGRPGLLRFDGQDRYWLSLAPVAERPWWQRGQLAALLNSTSSAARVLGLDVNGRVMEDLRSTRADSSPLGAALVSDGWLYLGGQSVATLSRVRLAEALHRPDVATGKTRSDGEDDDDD